MRLAAAAHARHRLEVRVLLGGERERLVTARARALEVSAALEREIPQPDVVRAGLLAIIESEGFGEDAAHRRARPAW